MKLDAETVEMAMDDPRIDRTRNFTFRWAFWEILSNCSCVLVTLTKTLAYSYVLHLRDIVHTFHRELDIEISFATRSQASLNPSCSYSILSIGPIINPGSTPFSTIGITFLSCSTAIATSCSIAPDGFAFE